MLLIDSSGSERLVVLLISGNSPQIDPLQVSGNPAAVKNDCQLLDDSEGQNLL